MVSQGKSLTSEPHQEQGADQEGGAGEHGQRVGTDEAGLHPAQPTGLPPIGGHAVDGTVDAAVVEEDQEPGELLAGPHEHDLVEGVLVEVPAGRPGSAATRAARRPGPAGGYIKYARPRRRRRARRSAWSNTGTATPCALAGHRRPARASRDGADRPEEHAEQRRAERQHHQRDRHDQRRLVRVRVVGPAALAVERHEEQPGHVERGDAGAEHRGRGRRPRAASRRRERGLDDLVLAPEAGERRERR